MREPGRLEYLLERAQVQGPGQLPDMMAGQSRHRWCAEETEAKGFSALKKHNESNDDPRITTHALIQRLV